MHRYKIVGYNRQRRIICYVTASSYDQAKHRAYDDMGLLTIASIRKVQNKF